MQLFIDYLGELNVLAVLVAAIAAFMSGAIWYSKPVLAYQWGKEIGFSKKKMDEGSKDGMGKVMGLSFLSTLVTAVAMGLLVKVLVLNELYQGALFGAMVAVGLLGMNKLMMSQFEQRSLKYWLIVLGGDIFALSVMGAILAVWQ